MTRCIALLSFYDEQPQHLIRCIASLAGLCSHVVAIDGRYAHFPAAADTSPPEQHQAIQFACGQLGLDLTLHVPSNAFDTEVSKRKFLFDLGSAVAEPGDWFFVVDADEAITDCDLTAADLDALEEDAADVRFIDPVNTATDRLRMLFRVVPGMTVGPHEHFVYRDGEGRVLWGKAADDPIPAADLTDRITVCHFNHERDTDRKQAGLDYYATRRAEGLETRPCDLCSQSPGKHSLPRFDGAAQGGASADWLDVCLACVPALRKRNRRTLGKLGLTEDVQATIAGRTHNLRDLYPDA